MSGLEDKARELLVQFKGDRYAFGAGTLDRIGAMTGELGRKALVVSKIQADWLRPTLDKTLASLKAAGVEVVGTVAGAKPNAPREDVYRIHGHIMHKKPDVIVSVDSGSGIDACKGAAVLATFGDIEAELDPYFGAGHVTKLCEQTGRKVLPVVAVMTAASSAAHLTKYSNITDPVIGQKKLIIDEAIIPPRTVFDYSLTASQPMELTLDGGLDGLSHCLEVYLGIRSESVAAVEPIALCAIELVICGLTALVKNPGDKAAREQIALATDLGGYAIMIGGTNGPHLNSFSLVKYLTHGRACALMCPYYTLFFSGAVEDRVRNIAAIYKKHGYIEADIEGLCSGALGLAGAEGMIAFNRSIGFPTTLGEIEGIDESVLEKILTAAKDPQLQSKLQNMPVPLTADSVDRYMGSVLAAAWDGDLKKVITQ